MAPHQLLLALGARLLLVMIGVPALLQARMEVAGPLWSKEAIQEAAAQLRLASGEGQGTAGAANPLLALLAGAAADRTCLSAAGLAADAASAWLLSRLAGDSAGVRCPRLTALHAGVPPRLLLAAARCIINSIPHHFTQAGHSYGVPLRRWSGWPAPPPRCTTCWSSPPPARRPRGGRRWPGRRWPAQRSCRPTPLYLR